MPQPVPLKVCHVYAGTEGGRWVFDQLEELRNAHGCEVSVVVGGREGRTVDLFRAAGIDVKVFNFRLKGFAAWCSIPLRVLRLAVWLRRERFDVVQSHLIQSTLFARPAAWLADVPVRLEMITGPFFIQTPAIRALETATATMETGIIPSCRLTGDLYRAAGIPARLVQEVLYYGPRAGRFDPASATPAGLRAEFGLSPDAPLIGSVAMFYPRYPDSDLVPSEARGRHVKGQDVLIAAMPRVLREFPEARLVLVGSGSGPRAAEAEAQIRDLVRAAGIEDRVLFTGWRPDVASIYVDLNVSVQPSINDNLGGTIESLLMARPTIATRVGGLVDSVVDGETGLLVPPADADALAEAILTLLRDPARAAALGQAGRARMLVGFTRERTGAGLAALYRRQRDVAPSAYRLGRGLARIVPAALIHAPRLARALLWDYWLRERLLRR